MVEKGPFKVKAGTETKLAFRRELGAMLWVRQTCSQ